jgi:hypothetical protein
MATRMPLHSNVSAPGYRTIRILLLVDTCLEGFLEARRLARAALSANTGASQFSPEELNRFLTSIALDSDARIAFICRLRPCHLRWCWQRAISHQMAIERRATRSALGCQPRSQWSVHPIDAIQRLLLSLFRSAARPSAQVLCKHLLDSLRQLGRRWPLTCAKLISLLRAGLV